MSEPIPESIPLSAQRGRHKGEPPAKRRAISPKSKHASELDALFRNPEREIKLPSAPQQKELAPPPEIVTNVQGSSAGAGSGEFHVYKASRRREAERLRMMEDDVEKQKKDREWEEGREKLRVEDEKKLNRNRARRAKQRLRKEKAKQDAKVGRAPEDDSGITSADVHGNIEADGTSAHDVTAMANGSKLRNQDVDDEDGGFTEAGIIVNEE